MSADAVGDTDAETDEETVGVGDTEFPPVPVITDEVVPEVVLVGDASAVALPAADIDEVTVVVPDALGDTSALREPAGDAVLTVLPELTTVDDGERVMSGDGVAEVEGESIVDVVAVEAPDTELLGVLDGEETVDGEGTFVTVTFADSEPSGEAELSGVNVIAAVSERLPVTEKLFTLLLESVGDTDLVKVGLAELVANGVAETIGVDVDAVLREADTEALNTDDDVDDGDANADAENVGETESLPVLTAESVAEKVTTPLAVP